MRIVLMIVMFSISSIVAAGAGNSMVFTDDSVCAVARSSLGSFLDKIPPGHESRYGFLGRNEFARASLGVPIRVYTPDPDSAPRHSGDLPEYPRALNEWRIPVLVDDEYRMLLTVAVVDGNLETVDIGAAVLAREFGEFHKMYPGKTTGLLRLQSLQCDVIIIDRTGSGLRDGDYYPMRSARSLFSDDTPSPRARSEVFNEIKRRYRQRSTTHSPQE